MKLPQWQKQVPQQYNKESGDYTLIKTRFGRQEDAVRDANTCLYLDQEYYLIQTEEEGDNWLWCTDEDWWLLALPRKRKITRRAEPSPSSYLGHWHDEYKAPSLP